MTSLPKLPDMIVIDKHIPTGIVIRGYSKEQMLQFYSEGIQKGLELAWDCGGDVEEPSWTGYECPNTFQDGVRAHQDKILELSANVKNGL